MSNYILGIKNVAEIQQWHVVHKHIRNIELICVFRVRTVNRRGLTFKVPPMYKSSSVASNSTTTSSPFIIFSSSSIDPPPKKLKQTIKFHNVTHKTKLRAHAITLNTHPWFRIVIHNGASRKHNSP